MQRKHTAAVLSAAVVFLFAASQATAAPIQATDNQAMCVSQNTAPLDQLAADHATVMRVILSPAHIGEATQCVTQARAAGYKVYLSLAYDNTQTPQEDAAWFAAVLPQYEPLWAVSVGNEQPLQPGGSSPAAYRAVWDAVEPVLPRAALHVFADAAPWDEGFVKQAWTTTSQAPVGADAIAYHCYNTATNQGGVLAEMPEFGAWAASQNTPLWCSEATAWLDDPATFAAAVANTPNLQLISNYYWPQPAAAEVPGWVPPSALPRAVAAAVTRVRRTAHRAHATTATHHRKARHEHALSHHPPHRTGRSSARMTWSHN